MQYLNLRSRDARPWTGVECNSMAGEWGQTKSRPCHYCPAVVPRSVVVQYCETLSAQPHHEHLQVVVNIGDWSIIKDMS